ncbi:hypothetical protein lerEdw1_010837, partial [Lerista edwardsae]
SEGDRKRRRRCFRGCHGDRRGAARWGFGPAVRAAHRPAAAPDAGLPRPGAHLQLEPERGPGGGGASLAETSPRGRQRFLPSPWPGRPVSSGGRGETCPRRFYSWSRRRRSRPRLREDTVELEQTVTGLCWPARAEPSPSSAMTPSLLTGRPVGTVKHPASDRRGGAVLRKCIGADVGQSQAQKRKARLAPCPSGPASNPHDSNRAALVLLQGDSPCLLLCLAVSLCTVAIDLLSGPSVWQSPPLILWEVPIYLLYPLVYSYLDISRSHLSVRRSCLAIDPQHPSVRGAGLRCLLTAAPSRLYGGRWKPGERFPLSEKIQA